MLSPVTVVLSSDAIGACDLLIPSEPHNSGKNTCLMKTAVGAEP